MNIIAETAASLPKEFVLAAIDGGGSKTECAIINQDGKVLGVGRGGPSRIPYVGVEKSVVGLRDAVRNAVSDNVLPIRAVLVICTHRLSDNEQLRGVLEEFFESPIARGTEADAAFGAAGIFSRHGIAHVGGTGVTTWGFMNGVQKVMVGGWGMTAGDEGGGFDIAMRGLRSAVRALDGRGKHTRLLDDAAKCFGFSMDRESILAALPRISERHILASFAPVVVAAAKFGDSAAIEIVEKAISEQSLCILAAARFMFNSSDEFPLVLHGSVACDDMIADGILKQVSLEFDNVRILLPDYSPAVGLAMFTLNEVLESANRR